VTQGLTAAELVRMRTDIESLMPDTCHILSLTTTPDGQGGQTESWGTVTAACRLDFISGREALVSAAIQPFSRAMLSVAQSAAITTANRVVHGGVTYNVQSVNQDASWLAVKRCILEAVR
jgi:head-tail adaptor